MLRANPSLIETLQKTLERWRQRDDPNSRPLLLRWADIIDAHDWNAALAETEEGQKRRQASPLATLLPEETRLAIIREVKAMKVRGSASG